MIDRSREESTTFAHEYLHSASVGSRLKCELVYNSTGNCMSSWYNEKRIQGYNLLLLLNEQECEEEMLLDDWKQVIEDNFPIVYLLVQPLHDYPVIDPEIEKFIANQGFTRIR